jgi:hypothetical protein
MRNQETERLAEKVAKLAGETKPEAASSKETISRRPI